MLPEWDRDDGDCKSEIAPPLLMSSLVKTRWRREGKRGEEAESEILALDKDKDRVLEVWTKTIEYGFRERRDEKTIRLMGKMTSFETHQTTQFCFSVLFHDIFLHHNLN
ncbi:hypothetical protein DY000_02004659 [Brassica cretica]|uniref:Uncharacterized protein n=1 Tax=Brassica cretica TaxID=69181 RepID=A0ABQ7CJP2_BRACR|nr:hypothetical protein DY000_02004659 [Brassica cretica]